MNLLDPLDHLVGAFVVAVEPAVDEESFHFELLEDERWLDARRHRRADVVVHGDGAAHGNPPKLVHVAADGRAHPTADIVKVAINAPGCRFFQTFLQIDFLVVERPIETQLVGQPIDFVVASSIANHVTV